VLPICYEEIVQLGDTSTNYQIAAGDRIFVPAKSFWENLCHKEKPCLPCGRGQVSCFALQGGECVSTHSSAAVTHYGMAPRVSETARPVGAPVRVLPAASSP
jgi:hypothetical protein